MYVFAAVLQVDAKSFKYFIPTPPHKTATEYYVIAIYSMLKIHGPLFPNSSMEITRA